jgi:predicted ArsR family transcriptional regulator
MITAETRKESYEEINNKKQQRYNQILDRLDRPKTAKEIAVELFELGLTNTTDRNTTAPRLTELEQMEQVKVIGKKKCDYTGRTVAVYERTQKGFEELNYNHIPRID